MSELESYRINVQRLLDLDSGEIFSNGQPEHAAIIFSAFFRAAKDRVNIFCKNLSPAVFSTPEVIEAFEKALRENHVPVSIVCQETPANEPANPLLDKIKGWIEEGLPVVFKVANPASYVTRLETNFATMDGKAYRFEPKRKEFVAFACMNNRDTCGTLDTLFNSLNVAAS